MDALRRRTVIVAQRCAVLTREGSSSRTATLFPLLRRSLAPSGTASVFPTAAPPRFSLGAAYCFFVLMIFQMIGESGP